MGGRSRRRSGTDRGELVVSVVSPQNPAPDPAPEHPFTRALRTWEAWSSANTWQWQAMRAAREQGHDWHEIGNALGLDSEEARRAYLAAVQRQQLAAQAMPKLGRLLRYDPRWLDLADDSDADRSR
jgi:hypothetical protein